MTEISLKRQARRFAEEHDVSYTRALAAVDEPLHRLKFELANMHPARPMGFTVTDSEDELLEPIAGDHPMDELRRKIRGTDQRPAFSYPQRDTMLLLELGRRTRLLLDSGAQTIWEHRALYRAGLTELNLEPVPNYYQEFKEPQDLLRDWNGPAMGIIPVAVLQDEYRKIVEKHDLEISPRQQRSAWMRKITLEELQSLFRPEGYMPSNLSE